MKKSTFKLLMLPVAAILFVILSFSTSPAQKKATELKYPEIAGWTLEEVSGSLADPNGYIASYRSKNNVLATVYVYDAGISDIPNELKGVVKREFDGVKQSLYTLEKMGAYEAVKEIKSDTISLGGAEGKVKALHAIFTFKLRGREVKSEAFVFPYKGYFGKIRMTRPVADSDQITKELNELFIELDKLFSK